MKKKLLVCTLAMAIVLGSSFSTFAAGTINTPELAASGASVEGDASIKTPTIDITVPTELDFTINPYKLTFEPDPVGAAGVTSDAVIYCAEQEIVSNSDVDVAVNVTDLKAELGEGISMATKAIDAKTTTKSIYLTMDVSAAGVAATPIVIPGATTDAMSKLKAAEKSAVVTMKANDTSSASDDTKAVVTLSGGVVANPTKTDSTTKKQVSDPWKSTDTVKVSVKFTFTPQVKTN